MDKAVEAVIEAVKQASPMLWSAAQAKVQADIANAHFWMWAWAIVAGIALLLFVFSVWMMSAYNGGDSDGAVVATFFVLTVLGGIISANYYTDILVREKAPQWYAIKSLVELSPLK